MKFRILMLLMSVSVITPAFLGSATAGMKRQFDENMSVAACDADRETGKSGPQTQKQKDKQVIVAPAGGQTVR